LFPQERRKRMKSKKDRIREKLEICTRLLRDRYHNNDAANHLIDVMHLIDDWNEENPIDGEYRYMIVNGKLESAEGKKVSYNEYGLPIYIDNYGMGSCHFSLIKYETDLEGRVKLDNIIWAIGQLKNSKAVQYYEDIRKEVINTILTEIR